MAFGVYVHIPFCAKRCDYCAFATWTDRSHLVDQYLDACRVDIERAVARGMPAASSVFFGGGTPSLVPPARLVQVLDAIPRQPGCEVTVECNPDTITADLVRTYHAGGVTRVSLGVQSTQPRVLASLGRTHDATHVAQAVDLVRDAGFASFNVDLIYGASGETRDDWRRTLDDVAALDPPHVSAYALTVEPGTPLAGDSARHPDDDDQADKYAMCDDVLGAGGWHWYEISNWAKPGHECRHNLLYWGQGDYWGFGCAAHSHQAGVRWWNVRTPERYVAAIEAGESPQAGAEELDGATRALEALQLAVRTRGGVPAEALPRTPGDVLEGLVERRDDRFVLTRAGRLLANEVSLRLTPPAPAATRSPHH